MKNEVNKETTEQVGKRNSYWPLVLPVLFIAIASIGAYAWNFWGLPPSRKPSDWAAFATYISGTVGVAAVLATLIAFLITLRQQQRLIESQEQVVTLQRNDIQKRDAYNIATVIFPKMKDHLYSFLDCNISDFFVFNDVKFYNKESSMLLRSTMLSLFSDYEINASFVTFNETLINCDDPENNPVDYFLCDIRSCIEVVSQCFDHSPELGFYLHDTKIKKIFSCCLCYDYAANLCNEEKFFKSCDFLGIKPDCYNGLGVESKWYELGLALKDTKN